MQLKSWYTLLTVSNIHVVPRFLRRPSSFSPQPADMYSLHGFKLPISPKYITKKGRLITMWSPWEHYQILFKHKCNTNKHLHALTSLHSTYNLFCFFCLQPVKTRVRCLPRYLTGSHDCENIFWSALPWFGRLLPKNHSYNLLKNIKSKRPVLVTVQNLLNM